MRVYFDNSATTPLDPDVRRAMEPFLDGTFGNPSSLHQHGREARAAIEAARAEVAALVGAEPGAIVFTGSGTEADNLALVGAFEKDPTRRHFVASAIEHPAVLETLRYLESRSASVTLVRPDPDGLLSPDEIANALRPDTRLVSVMAANNVVGTLQPVGAIGRLRRERGVLFHSDAVQAAGAWHDTLARPFDFYLEHFPEDPGPREVILPHNPILTREMDVKRGDILIGRPLGRHSGLVNYLNRTPGGLQVRVEGLWIG